MSELSQIVEAFIAKGDLTHLALGLWAGAASLLCFALLRALGLANQQLAAAAREVSDANRHVREFVRELARFNRRNGA